MSRTEHFTLPRIPTSHARVTSPGKLQHHSARTARSKNESHRTRTEPSYTAYLGTPRQDIPVNVFRDAALYEDVFDKEGSLFRRQTDKFNSPLSSRDYNSLHDPHCRRLYLNNKRLREHLIGLGLLTEDLKVVATTKEQRQRIRAHEMLERKEQLLQKLEDKERERVNSFMGSKDVPAAIKWTHERQSMRAQMSKIRQKQSIEREEVRKKKEKEIVDRKLEERKEKWKRFVEEYELEEQRRRNAEKAIQKEKDLVKYINVFGMSNMGIEMASWYRDSEVIAERMRNMALKHKTDMQNEAMAETLNATPETGSLVGEVDQLDYLKQVRQTAEEIAMSKDKKTVDDIKQPERDNEAKGQQKEEGSTDADNEALSLVPEKDLKASPEQEELTDKQTLEGAVESHSPNEQGIRGGSPEELATDDVKDTTDQIPLQTDKQKEEDTEITSDTASKRQKPTEEESIQLLAQFIILLGISIDEEQTGFIQATDFMQLLTLRETGLDVSNEELHSIVAYLDAENTGWIAYYDTSTVMRDVFMALYAARPNDIKPPSVAHEKAWCQMYTPTFGFLYFNTVDGTAQRERPPEYRPYLADEVFEDAIVDLFQSADVHKQGIIDKDAFRQLLYSATVSEQLFDDQKDSLLGLFEASALNGQMNLEDFVPLARTMITMVYRNQFKDQFNDDWLELNSNKFGSFWLNKSTGEIMFPEQIRRERVRIPSQASSDVFVAPSLSDSQLNAIPEQFGVVEELPEPGTSYQHQNRPSTFSYTSTLAGMAYTGYHGNIPSTADETQRKEGKKKKLKKKKSFAERGGIPALKPKSRPSTTTTAIPSNVMTALDAKKESQ